MYTFEEEPEVDIVAVQKEIEKLEEELKVVQKEMDRYMKELMAK
jgi:type I restriction enzyme M protein